MNAKNTPILYYLVYICPEAKVTIETSMSRRHGLDDNSLVCLQNGSISLIMAVVTERQSI